VADADAGNEGLTGSTASGYSALTTPGAPRSIVMQPDDPSITPVSTAASAKTLSIFVVLVILMGHAFLLFESP
jgi:hypothetical protein